MRWSGGSRRKRTVGLVLLLALLAGALSVLLLGRSRMAWDRACTIARRQLPGLLDGQVRDHATLVDPVDLVGVDEAQTVVGLDHDPVEDVLLLDVEDLLDGADLLVAGGANRRALLQHVVRDGRSEIRAVGRHAHSLVGRLRSPAPRPAGGGSAA